MYDGMEKICQKEQVIIDLWEKEKNSLELNERRVAVKLTKLLMETLIGTMNRKEKKKTGILAKHFQWYDSELVAP